MTRARLVRPNQCPSGSRYSAGISAFDDLVVQRLRDARVLGCGEARDVDRHDDVDRRVGAFRLDALLQTLVEEQHLRLDAGLRREGVEHRLDQFGLAVGIDVDRAIRVGGAGKQRGEREGSRCGIGSYGHRVSPGRRGSRRVACFIPGSGNGTRPLSEI